MSNYLDGSDVLGATDQAVVIRVHDPGAVVAAKAGTAGDLAFAFLPQTITNKVYDELVKKIREALAAEKVSADVQVVTLPVGAGASASGGAQVGKRGPSDLWAGMALGAGAVGIGWALWRLLLRGLILGRGK